MASSGIFIGLTEDELLAIKVQALADITSGKVLSSYSDSGSSATRSVTMTAKERLSEAMFALSRLDPQTYGTRKTVVSTNWSNPIDQ
jgi:monoamine oxidase